MQPIYLIIIGAVVAFIGYAITTYNFFQTARTRIQASIQEIGNQLKRQANLIPNLAESVKGYLKHEKGIFEDLTSARKAVDAAVGSSDGTKINKAVEQMTSLIPKLQVIVESNPELKGNTVVSDLMKELRDTADKVMYARRTLIDLTADYNVKRVTFPSNIVANIFKFKEEKGLVMPTDGEHTTVSLEETKDVQVKL
jgi:LemA protein